MLNKQPDEIRKQDSMNQDISAPETPKRRKLVSSAISASAMIVTVASRPAWADLCTRSGLNSANLSGQHTFEGCGRSAGMWKTQLQRWPEDCPSTQLFTVVFGTWVYKGSVLFANQTLGQVIQIDGGSISNPGNIAMHVVGAYVNAHAFPKSSPSGKGYVYSPTEVVSMFKTAANASCIAGNKNALQNLANTFDAANNKYDATTVWP